MNVKELCEKLQKYDGFKKVTITDGFNSRCYDGLYSIQEFDGMVDIGLGGTLECLGTTPANKTTVSSIVQALKSFPNDYTVIFSDGFDSLCYRGNYTVDDFFGDVDIGIGGTLENNLG